MVIGSRPHACSVVSAPPRDLPRPLPSAAVDAIRLVIADDHPVVRSGLKLLLDAEDGFTVVAEAGEVETARRMVALHRPDVMLIDLNMPGELSLPAIPELARQTAVVVLTMQNDPAFAREALQAGARGYVLKEAADVELVQAVRAAAEGRHLSEPRAGSPDRRGAGTGGPARRPHRARARDPAPDRARAHERRHRQAALSQRPHRRVPPGAHPAEDPPHHARRARPLRVGPLTDHGLTGRAARAARSPGHSVHRSGRPHSGRGGSKPLVGLLWHEGKVLHGKWATGQAAGAVSASCSAKSRWVAR